MNHQQPHPPPPPKKTANQNSFLPFFPFSPHPLLPGSRSILLDLRGPRFYMVHFEKEEEGVRARWAAADDHRECV